MLNRNECFSYIYQFAVQFEYQILKIICSNSKKDLFIFSKKISKIFDQILKKIWSNSQQYLCLNMGTILAIPGKLGDDPGISIYWLPFELLLELMQTKTWMLSVCFLNLEYFSESCWKRREPGLVSNCQMKI